MIVPIWVAYYLIKEKLSQSIQNTAEFAIVIIPLLSGYLYYAITQREINPKEIFFTNLG